MLDVQRRIDVDARLQQPHYVLPSFGVRHAGGIGVGQLIDDQKLRMQNQGGVEIEFPELRAPVFDL